MPANCPAPFEMFRLATESLGPELYRRASYRGIWLNLIPRDTYKMGTGLVQSVFTIGRIEPTADIETWTPITTSTNGTFTGTCGVTYVDVDPGFTEVTYGPEAFGLQGPIICQDDLIYNFRAASFLEAYVEQMKKRSQRSVENRLLHVYMQKTPKSVASVNFNTTYDVTTFPTERATCELSQTMLDQVAAELNEEGAPDPNSSGWITLGSDGPVYPLYIGQTASQKIWLDNSEFRKDIRFAEPSILMKRLGATAVLKNFRHVINLFPPRYNYTGGVYVRVNTWIMPAGTQGVEAEINPLWRAAAYEVAIVLNPWVMTEEIVKPVNQAANASWPVKNYFGEWDFVVGGREISTDATCYDPQKMLGRHFAQYKHALKPIFPRYGRTIIFRRCPTATFDCTTCS